MKVRVERSSDGDETLQRQVVRAAEDLADTSGTHAHPLGQFRLSEAEFLEPCDDHFTDAGCRQMKLELWVTSELGDPVLLRALAHYNNLISACAAAYSSRAARSSIRGIRALFFVYPRSSTMRFPGA